MSSDPQPCIACEGEQFDGFVCPRCQREHHVSADGQWWSTWPELVDEEQVPHPFRSRTRYEPGDDRDIWCADCEYHRDYEVHQVQPLQEQSDVE